jgi:hypothetical protein
MDAAFSFAIAISDYQGNPVYAPIVHSKGLPAPDMT